MNKNAREQKRRRTVRIQHQNREIQKKKREEQALARPLASIEAPRPDPQKSFSPLYSLDFFEAMGTVLIACPDLLLGKGSIGVIDATPGSFRELVDELKKRS